MKNLIYISIVVLSFAFTNSLFAESKILAHAAQTNLNRVLTDPRPFLSCSVDRSFDDSLGYERDQKRHMVKLDFQMIEGGKLVFIRAVDAEGRNSLQILASRDDFTETDRVLRFRLTRIVETKGGLDMHPTGRVQKSALLPDTEAFYLSKERRAGSFYELNDVLNISLILDNCQF